MANSPTFPGNFRGLLVVPPPAGPSVVFSPKTITRDPLLAVVTDIKVLTDMALPEILALLVTFTFLVGKCSRQIIVGNFLMFVLRNNPLECTSSGTTGSHYKVHTCLFFLKYHKI